ncbi:MAG: Double-strand break repair protein mre11a [Chaenotheca gracillima]|nr:MAG: Double-strand break repair protein mre11a [Chaenotheca gracillima]
MPTFFPSISADLREWALAQPLFFTASAPLTGKHINLSPKGLTSSTFTIFPPEPSQSVPAPKKTGNNADNSAPNEEQPGSTQAAYVDFTGSGAETIAHVYENGRATIMLCSFGPSPRIMRLFCRAKVIESGEVNGVVTPLRVASDGDDGSQYQRGEFEELLRRMWLTKNPGKGVDEKVARGRPWMEGMEGARSIIMLDVWKVQTSCGFGVPIFFPSKSSSTDETRTVEQSQPSTTKSTSTAPALPYTDRPTLANYGRKLVAKSGVRKYQAKCNSRSLDGLMGLKAARRQRGEWVLLGDCVSAVKRAIQRQAFGFVIGVLMGLLFALLIGLIVRAQDQENGGSRMAGLVCELCGTGESGKGVVGKSGREGWLNGTMVI